MNISEERLQIIKMYEGLRLQTYDDATGKTLGVTDPNTGSILIGYGTKANPSLGISFKKGDVITEEIANDFLSKTVAQKETVINGLIVGKFASGNFTLNQNQFDALVMLIFNVGESAIVKGKTIRNCLEANDMDGAADGFLLWCKVNSVINDRLLERRQIEKEIFLTPV